MQVVYRVEVGSLAASVLRDVQWNEYRVRFSKDLKYLGPATDYHTSDLKDAKNTADAYVRGD